MEWPACPPLVGGGGVSTRLLTDYLKIIVCTLLILSCWATDRYATIFHFVHNTTSLTSIGIPIYP